MTESTQQDFPKTHRAVRWHPPSYDVRVEDVPFPKWVGFQVFQAIVRNSPPPPEICRIEHPDDAIVKITVWIFSGTVSTDPGY